MLASSARVSSSRMSPVHFASAFGMLTAFMDKVFFTNIGSGIFENKPASVYFCVATSRFFADRELTRKRNT